MHAPCSGGDTVRTGFYPKVLAGIMVNNMFIGSDCASIACIENSQPPSRAIDAVPVVGTPVVELSSKTIVSDLACVVANQAELCSELSS